MDNRYELILARREIAQIKRVGGIEIQYRGYGLVVEVKQIRGVEQFFSIRVFNNQILGIPDLKSLASDEYAIEKTYS